MIKFTRNPFITTLALHLLILCIAGCGPQQVKEITEEEVATLFYPELPQAPRIQYLASFSIARDVIEVKEDSALAKFVLGEANPEELRGPRKPYGVALHRGEIHVVDTRGGGYVIFDLAKREYRTVVGSGNSTMTKPINITIDAEGMKYVTDTAIRRIHQFDGNDKYQKSYELSGSFTPVDVAVVEEKLYVLDIAEHNVKVFDKQNGELLTSFSSAGADEGKLYQPTNIALGPDNNLYISDTGNFRVSKFNLDGEYLGYYGRGVGTGPGNFARPKGVALDREGRLYVVDAAFENVQIFNQEGKLLLFFAESAANHPGGLNLPTAIAIDYESVPYFQQYADPKFKLEYVILVANQFGRSRVNAYGFGRMSGMDYDTEDRVD